jgi:nucleotide-binding universal stress UspA family protein
MAMYRDLLLPTTGTPGDTNALEAAIALARMFDAHLSVVETVNLPMFMPSPWGIVPDTLLTGLYAELNAMGEANVEALRTRLAREDISHEVRLADAKFVSRTRCIAMQARHADLCVLTGSVMQTPFEWEIVETTFSGMLFESGRPVLLMPPRHPMQWPLRHAVVAWRPTREATRALHDALPLLMRAESVDVVAIAPEPGESRYGDVPGADIGEHLARHGLKVNVVGLQRGAMTVATALLRHAAETDAQLLVAGGYGHSRLREWVLGGTTDDLMRAMDLPVLFSH